MIIFTKDEMNDVLQLVNLLCDGSNKFKEITKKLVEDFSDYNAIGDEGCENFLYNLIGYKVKCKTDGWHKNDGQMVEYKFTFESPKNEKTIISTEMCLMIGWNHCDSEEIK